MKRTLTALTVLVLAAGCAASTHGPRATPGRSSAGLQVLWHPAPHQRVVEITERANGHVVHAHRGDMVRWVLVGTYWHVHPAVGAVLVKLGEQETTVRPIDNPGCVPGQGCGIVESDYRVQRAGQVILQAHRNACGEAMRCTSEKARFQVTLVVS